MYLALILPVLGVGTLYYSSHNQSNLMPLHVFNNEVGELAYSNGTLGFTRAVSGEILGITG